MWLGITLGAAAAGLGLGWLGHRRSRALGWGLWGLTALGLSFVVVTAAICWDAPDHPVEPDYGLLLGCGLSEEGRATPELERRCTLALSWLEAHPELPLIVSGGDPGRHGITEAAVMVQWLEDHGADPDRLYEEGRASDTRENLLFSLELARKQGFATEHPVILTSEYHQTRARFLARQLGQEPGGVSSETPWFSHVAASVREVYCMISEWLELLA